jgi:integrase
MSNTLRRMLLEWKQNCPSRERVFPSLTGDTLLYNDYRRRVWMPALQRMGLPRVSIHSARASFISMLQASGTELAVASSLAGHKTPAITLAYYTHALKGSERAIAALDAELEPPLESRIAPMHASIVRKS